MKRSKQIQCKHLSDVDVLRAVQQSREALKQCPHCVREAGLPVWPYEFLPAFPERVVLQKMERMVNAGLLDYGVSLRTAWVTPAGEELLASAPTP